MLASPQTVTINAVATGLDRIIDDGLSSTYSSADGTLTFVVSHQTSKTRVRRMVRIDQKVIAANPLTAIQQYQKAGVYVVIDEPEFGFTSTEIQYLVDALKTWLSSANIQAVLASRH